MDAVSAVLRLAITTLQRAELARTRPDLCPYCSGTGDHQQVDMGPDDTRITITPCDSCHGSGKAEQ